MGDDCVHLLERLVPEGRFILDRDCVCGYPANARNADGVGAVVEHCMVDALAAMWVADSGVPMGSK